MTTPPPLTDAEITQLRAVAKCMPPRQTEHWARDMARLCDALTESRAAAAEAREAGRVEVERELRWLASYEHRVALDAKAPLQTRQRSTELSAGYEIAADAIEQRRAETFGMAADVGGAAKGGDGGPRG